MLYSSGNHNIKLKVYFSYQTLVTSNTLATLVTKMQAEEFILHFLRLFFSITSLIMAYLIWNYLNKKALGMQTILDQMIKDITVILSMNIISGSFVLIKISEKPYDHYIALAICMSRNFFVLAMGWQIFVTGIIRYLSVFYHSLLNNVDEIKIIKTTRLFVGLVSLILILGEDFKHHFSYIYLTNKNVDKELARWKALQIVLVIDILVLAMVQLRIEIFKIKVDHNTEENENQNFLEMAFEYSTNTIRIVLLILCLTLFVMLVYVLSARKDMEELTLSRLRIQVFIHFFLTNMIPMILIKRNPNMYKYCVKNIKCL